MTEVEGDPKALFSIATTRCREGATLSLGLFHSTLDMYLMMLSVKQGGIKYHFLSLWYDSTWDWTPFSRAIYIPNHSTWAGCDRESILRIQFFSFSKTGCHTKLKDPNLPYYLSLPKEGIVRFISLTRILALTVSSRNSGHRVHFHYIRIASFMFHICGSRCLPWVAVTYFFFLEVPVV